jgi:broad specificity phosphatase PhoE
VNATSLPLPAALWLVRHGESDGNVANALARQNHALRLDLDINDIDVPLSPLGREQARALGEWLGGPDCPQQPTVAVVSPYVRARQTTEIVLEAAGMTGLPVMYDERLRDREQGVIDRLTGAGLRDLYPEEAKRRDYLGKFWYRPMGGESWADVAMRVRAALLELRLTMPDERVLVVSHDVPILLVRYVIEQLSPSDVVALSGRLPNCSLTRYERDGDKLRLDVFADASAVAEDDTAVVTAHERSDE